MSQPLVVVGAGGFGREVLDVLLAVNRASKMSAFHVIGVLDDRPSAIALARLADRDARYLGSTDDWLATRADAQFVIAIGDPHARHMLATRFADRGLRPATAVHPSATIGSASKLGAGTTVCAGVVISTNVHIGRHVHINSHVTIGHDVRISDYASLNPCATISGEVTVGSGALIGASATVLQGLRVGPDSVIGACACVTRNVVSGAVVKGIPAK